MSMLNMSIIMNEGKGKCKGKDDTLYKCKHCDRGYKSKNYYNRHVLVCEILSKSTAEREQEDEELADTPSMRKMYELLLEMSFKYSNLERKYNELHKSIESKRKKLNIIDWLNNNYTIATKFADWCRDLKLGRKHLEFIFETNYIPGIINIFEEFLPISKEVELPIKSFDQKLNTLFVYIDDEKKWRVMSEDDFKIMVSVISKQIMGEFVKWQDENSNLNKNNRNDKFDIEYALNIQKVIGAKYTKQQLYTKIHHSLYNYLKMNLKNVIEYEFSF